MPWGAGESDMSERVVADLHVHTTASDGRMELDEVPTAARAAALETVAVTDHDRIHPGLTEPVTRVDGVRVVRGIELRVDDGDQRLDLLGYGVRETPALVGELDRLQRDRRERAASIVDRVEAHTGVDLDFDVHDGVGRPHIARAIAESDAPYDYRGAFAELIGSACPCYVARELTPAERGVVLLKDACAVVGLAHPFRYPDVDTALEFARDLDAVERFYPYGRAVDDDLIERVAREADLLLTGGSDAHDDRLGLAGLDADRAATFLDNVLAG